MASRKELKEQRRREREEAERRAEQAQRRRRRIRVYAIAAGAVAAIAGGAVFVLLGGLESDPADAFAAHPEGIDERAAEAGIRPGGDHFHPTVRVVANGDPVPIPTDIFSDGSGRPVVPMHFHPGDEQLHAEGVQEGALTLGQLMTVWGVPLTPSRLGDYRAGGDRTVSVLVKPKGKDRFTESKEFGRLQLRDGAEVYVIYGTPEQSPFVQ